MDSNHRYLLNFLARMWRNSERASLENKPYEIEPRAMGRGEREGEAPDRLRGEPGCGLVRDMSGVVVENDLYGGIGGVGRVKQLEELDESNAQPGACSVVTFGRSRRRRLMKP
jgi:hypothetical protein